MEYFAYVDSIHRNEKNSASITLDVMPKDMLGKLESDGPTYMAREGFLTSQIEVEANSWGGEFFVGKQPILLGKWYRATKGAGVPARLFSGITDEGSEFWVSILEVDSSTTDRLKSNVSLDGIDDSDRESIKKYLRLDNFCKPFSIAVYNVGQGNCNAILCSEKEPWPRLYFDLGGGVGANAHTYPQNVRFCFSQKQPVILSHWHMDHWVSAIRNPAAKASKWIVPRQPLGPSQAKFAWELNCLGNLHIWPKEEKSIKTNWGSVYKLPSSQDKNDSGLVIVVDLDEDNKGLCPGDAKYNCIPQKAKKNLVGLVASHHGGDCVGNVPPQAKTNGRVVFSCGNGNSYGHPSKGAMELLSRFGWNDQRSTSHGHIAIPQCHKALNAPCHGECTLTIVP